MTDRSEQQAPGAPVREGARPAPGSEQKKADARQKEEALDESLMMTFPASDPPAWMGERAAVTHPPVTDSPATDSPVP